MMSARLFTAAIVDSERGYWRLTGAEYDKSGDWAVRYERPATLFFSLAKLP